MKTEYKTTYGDGYIHDCIGEYTPDDPVPPQGEGWELVGFAASGGKLYWTWRRVVSENA